MTIRLWCASVLLCVAALGWRPATAQVSLDLRDANLSDFVQIVAEATGRSFVLDSRVGGTVSVIAPEDVTSSALYEIFLNVLELNRLTIVEGDEADRIVPMEIAGQLAPGEERTVRGGAFETRVIRVENIPMTEIVDVIRPRLPEAAVLSTVPGANLIILSARRPNQRRIESLVSQLDQPRQQTIETIRLNDSNAVDMLGVIQALDVAPEGSSLSADAQANALIVSGPAQFRERIRRLVAELDTPQRSRTTRVVRLSYADSKNLEAVIRESFGQRGGAGGEAAGGAGVDEGLTVVAEPQSNALIVTAPQDRVGPIVAAIEDLDRRPRQVLIEAVIFEMSMDNFSDLSVQFAGIFDDAIAGGVQFSLQERPTLTGLVSSVLSGSRVVNPGDGGTIGGGDFSGRNRFGGFVSAIARKSSTRLLSTPSIMTLNNQEAEIVVAQKVPFVTGRFATVDDSAVPEQPFQTIQREDVGLTLRVTPQITVDDMVRLAIVQETSNLTNTASAAGSEITNKRSLSTNVLVRDARVIMLGGLLQDAASSIDQKVPGLGDLPLLGGLFRGRQGEEEQNVLLIMLRPRILSSDDDARQLSRELARKASEASQFMQPPPGRGDSSAGVGGFTFDGIDLNQPFDNAVVDDVAEGRRLPPLPPRLKFRRE